MAEQIDTTMKVICKHCGKETQFAYLSPYGGFCADCQQSGIAGLVTQIESLREQLETMTLARDVMESERDGLRQAKQDSEAQGARNYAELMEARAEVERLRKEVDEIEDIERMALAMLHGGHTMPSTLYHRLLERERIAAEVTP